MSLRLTPSQASTIVEAMPLRPADSVMPTRRTQMASAICTTCDRDDGFLDFRDHLSLREWGISGMCQLCQDAFWG